ncbi:hypothetical protein ACIQVF_00625 [Streptomyces tendae]
MREKPLSKLGDELPRIRRDVSRVVGGTPAPAGFGVDRKLGSGTRPHD